MGATKVMVIRHAEKPDANNVGVTSAGAQDPESLIVQGWQRAGALTCFFAPTYGASQNSEIASPHFLYASAIGKSESERPLETITPLRCKLNLPINSSFLASDYQAMVTGALASDGVVLICWKHEDILPLESGGDSIVTALLSQTSTPLTLPGVPQQPWPENRFDMVLVLDRPCGSGAFVRFTQVPQMLLCGDSAALFE